MAVVPALLVGGRYDGSRLSPRARNTFVFVGGSEDEPRHFAKNGTGRELYRSLGHESRSVGDEPPETVEILLYAGHTHRLCRCGSYIEQSQWKLHTACQAVAA